MSSWKIYFNKKENIYKVIFTFVLLFITLYLFPKFILYVESRKGIILQDPVFNWFTAIDLNWIIFAMIYISLITGLVLLFKYPEQLLIAVQSYILLVIFRTIAMYIVPLDPPLGTIDLQDPLVFLIGTGKPVTKDLFFSGHTSTLFLIFLTSVNKNLKYVFLTAAILVGLFVILQKVHYSIDVFAAPFFAYTCYRIIKNLKLY